MTRQLKLFTLASAFCVPTVASNGLAEERSAREILQRAIDSAGGDRALATLESPMMWMERGTSHGMGESVPFVAQYAAKWPGWYRQEVEHQFTLTTSAENAWVSVGADSKLLEGAQRKELLTQARMIWAERLFPLKANVYTLSVIDGIQVDGRPTNGIMARHADGRDMKFFFDKQTNLIAKIETTAISPQHGPDPVLSEAYYSHHKTFGGVRMPSKRRVYYDGKLFLEAETVDYKVAATLDPSHFAAPE